MFATVAPGQPDALTPAAPPQRAGTQMFATVTPGQPDALTPAAPAQRSSTQMFATVTPGQPDALTPAAPPQRAGTQMFATVTPGQVDAPTPAAPSQRAGTQMFAATPAPGTEVAPAAGEADFAIDEPAADEPSAPAFEMASPDVPFATEPAVPPAPRVRAAAGRYPGRLADSVGNRPTLTFEAPVAPPAEPPSRGSTQPFAALPSSPVDEAPLVSTLSDEPPPVPDFLPAHGLEAKAPVALPAEPDLALPPLRADPVEPLRLPPLERPARRHAKTTPAPKKASGGGGAFWAVLLVLLAGAAAGGYFLYQRYTSLSPDIPELVRASHRQAFSLLRRDDATSIKDVIGRLTDLLQQNPEFAEARADLLTARILQFDDVRLSVRQVEQRIEELRRRIRRLETTQAPADWSSRVNTMSDSLKELEAKVAPWRTEARELDAELGKGFTAIQAVTDPSPGARIAVARAIALYLAVKGDHRAQKFVDEYVALGGKGGWDTVARAELVLNSRASPLDEEAALKQLDALRATDSTFIRPYVLTARLLTAQNKTKEAQLPLESARALNPQHVLARSLLEQLEPVEP
jgi:hypothetical protein